MNISKCFEGTRDQSKVEFGEQFSISFKGTLKNIFGNKGDFGDFSMDHGNTDPLRVSLFTFSHF